MPEWADDDGAETCTEEGCDRAATVVLDVPWWDGTRAVCAAHARGMVTQDGVVAMPLEGKEDEWP